MTVFLAGVGAGALVASALWWLYVRHLSGVTSDLADIGSDLKHAANKVSAAGDQVAAAAQQITAKP